MKSTELAQMPQLTHADFARLSQFIHTQYGIKMPPAKKTMLESRLQKRLHLLGFTSFKAYCDYVFSATGQQQEVIPMIDMVATNKTDFFRESAHFVFLTEYILPELVSRMERGPLHIWSAGCSSGEEPYTLAIVLNEFIESHFASIDFQIVGTDISTQILHKAMEAIYAEERASQIPMLIKKKYFLRSKDQVNRTIRIVPALRKKVRFRRLNFMDEHYDVSATFDIVFCRNVLIYFDKKTQEKVIHRLCAKLNPGGYFFLGHSESINDMKVPLQQVRPTIFRRI